MTNKSTKLFHCTDYCDKIKKNAEKPEGGKHRIPTPEGCDIAIFFIIFLINMTFQKKTLFLLGEKLSLIKRIKKMLE